MRSLFALNLLCLIFLITGCQSTINKNTSKQPPAIQPAQVKAYLKKHPEFTQTFYNNWQKSQQQIKNKQQQNDYNQLVQQLFKQDLFFSLGNPSAKITLASFIDYSSIQSKHALKIINQLISKDKNIKIIIIPLATSPLAQTLTRLAFNAKAQGKLNQFHQALIKTTGLITNKDQRSIAKNLALNSRPLPKQYQQRSIRYITGLKLQSLPSYIIGFSEQAAVRPPLTITGKTNLYYLQGILKKYRETEKSRLAKILKEKKKDKPKPAIIVTEISTTPNSSLRNRPQIN
ncbi:thioredoxin domain-containing protein [Piscirickettsia litoralis]|uniref:Uncharacterized protein n=1 Tax=Piscirickettsia litoralis TaxID=1891921 RepID=A0ABX3A406_9GAMM|nr:hypothetical protein [Piscirickettsia litoralis]ODN43592.1 hypothetical protein BGC07_12565 [Piscirickettsia litoralis]